MKFKYSPLLIVAVVALLTAATARAQSPQTAKSSSVQLGDKVIVIPNPEGFEEAGSQFESVKQYSAATSPPGLEPLLIHFQVSDCELLRAGSRPKVDFSTSVNVIRADREKAQSNADLARLVAEIRKKGDVMLDPDGSAVQRMEKRVEAALSKQRSEAVDFDLKETENLGEFDVRPQVYSILVFMTAKFESGGTQRIRARVASMTVLNIGSRIISVNVYRKVALDAVKTDLKPAVSEVKQFTTKWVNEILAANQEKQ